MKEQHSLLGSRFLISKYTQLLLGNAFTNEHFPMELIGATIEELCFLLVRAEGLSVGQV
jgi:hypothetical protein